jgi:hypothetical protein
MNKIIKRFYPVEKLPADLQEGLPKHGHVHIELEPDLSGLKGRPIAQLAGSGRNVHGDAETVLSHVRTLREDR